MRKSTIKKKLIVIGGGFAGVTLIKNLSQKFDVTLVEKNNYQLFYPALFKALVSEAGTAEIFSSVIIKYDDIFGHGEIRFSKRPAKSVYPAENKILLKIGGHPAPKEKKLEYDYLVIAAGSEARDHDFVFQSFADVLKIRDRLESVFKNSAKKEMINITVVGGGITGCSLIAFLSEYASELAEKYGHPSELMKLKIVESHKCLIERCSPWLQRKITDTLKKIGVEIVLGNLFVPKEEKSQIIIWATGVKPIRFLEDKPDAFLCIGGRKNVFVVEAATAQSAVHQAKYVASALSAAVKKKKNKPYHSGRSYDIVELGSKYAFADLGFVKLSGTLARIIHELAFLRYLMSILSWPKALDWLRKYRSL